MSNTACLETECSSLLITCKYKQFYQMTTITKTITYKFIWQLDSAENYKFTKCKKLFNTKTMREIKNNYYGNDKIRS
jgi:hypothetical protein